MPSVHVGTGRSPVRQDRKVMKHRAVDCRTRSTTECSDSDSTISTSYSSSDESSHRASFDQKTTSQMILRKLQHKSSSARLNRSTSDQTHHDCVHEAHYMRQCSQSAHAEFTTRRNCYERSSIASRLESRIVRSGFNRSGDEGSHLSKSALQIHRPSSSRGHGVSFRFSGGALVRPKEQMGLIESSDSSHEARSERTASAHCLAEYHTKLSNQLNDIEGLINEVDSCLHAATVGHITDALVKELRLLKGTVRQIRSGATSHILSQAGLAQSPAVSALRRIVGRCGVLQKRVEESIHILQHVQA